MCGQFVNVIECNSCGKNHYVGHNRCKSRWCVSCNRVKSLAWLARLIPVLQDWIEQKKYVFMLNFTIKDLPDLSKGIDIINDAFRNMTNGDKNNRQKWKDRFPGMIRSLEVKIGEGSGLWHPHLHCIVLQDRYGKYFKEIKEEWNHAVKLAGGVAYIDAEGNEKYGSVWIKK